MKTYTVHKPSDFAGSEADERAVFVKDGFCWPALFVPFLWLLWHRLWLILLVYAALGAALMAASASLGDGPGGVIAILFAFAFAFEANNLRRWSLDRRGYRETGCSTGHSLDEAEIHYFCRDNPTPARQTGEVLPPSADAGTAAALAGTAAVASAGTDTQVTGLFPERES